VDIFTQEDGNAMHYWNIGNKLSINTARHPTRLKASKDTNISQKSSYSQHSRQLAEKQNVKVLFVHFWFTQSFPDFPVQGIISFDISSFWIIMDHPSLNTIHYFY
jgi:hypothetical protein